MKETTHTLDLSDWNKDKCLDWLETWSTTLMPSTYTDPLSTLKMQVSQLHLEAINLLNSTTKRQSAQIN